jgi:hypothetical protein
MDLTNSSDSLTVFLTNQQINCSNLPIASNNKPGAWIEIDFSEFSVKDYQFGEIKSTMSCYIFGSYWGAYGGYLGTASITSIDTIAKRVSGWIDFETNVFSFPLLAYGSFNVPYCSMPLSSEDSNSYHELLNIFELSQNYPNPFNPSTTMEFTLPKSEFVTLKVYNVLGEEIKTLVNNKLQAGNHTYEFDGSNLASGVYLYRIEAGEFQQVRKMVLIK